MTYEGLERITLNGFVLISLFIFVHVRLWYSERFSTFNPCTKSGVQSLVAITTMTEFSLCCVLLSFLFKFLYSHYDGNKNTLFHFARLCLFLKSRLPFHPYDCVELASHCIMMQAVNKHKEHVVLKMWKRRNCRSCSTFNAISSKLSLLQPFNSSSLFSSVRIHTKLIKSKR